MNKIILSIHEPCNQDWNAMTETAKGRFCSSCSKTVVDFTLLSDTQLINYFLKHNNEQTCGRLLAGQLDTALFIPVEPMRKRFGYWKYIAASALLFFTKASLKAQVKVDRSPQEHTLPVNKKADSVIFNAPQTLEEVRVKAIPHIKVYQEQMTMGAMSTGLRVTYTKTNTIKSFFLGESIRAFPNPAARGNSFNLSLNLKAAGIYNVEIASASGALLMHKQVDIRSLKSTQQIATDSRWAAGLYFVRLTDEVNKKIATCKLVLN